MTIKSVVVIGVGSFGGFFSRELLKYSVIEKIIVIDFDIVKRKNLKNSIYIEEDINHPKVDCLRKNLNDNRIFIINKKYEDVEFEEIKDVDVIIDCRDQVIQRGNEISLSISIIEGYTAIFDFRKNPPINSCYRGVYVDNVDENDLIRIGEISAKLIMSDNFKSYCDSEHVYSLNFGKIDEHLLTIEKYLRQQRIDIIYSEDNIASNIGVKQLKDESSFLQKYYEDRVYEYDQLENKVYGITNSISPIFQENQEVDVWIYDGSNEERPFPTKIKKGFFKSEIDVKNKLQSLLQSKLEHSNFDIVVSIIPTKTKLVVQLLEVTKGA